MLIPLSLRSRAIEFVLNYEFYQCLVDIKLLETLKMFDFEFKIKISAKCHQSIELDSEAKYRVIVLEFWTIPNVGSSPKYDSFKFFTRPSNVSKLKAR